MRPLIEPFNYLTHISSRVSSPVYLFTVDCPPYLSFSLISFKEHIRSLCESVSLCACWDQQEMPLLCGALCSNHGYADWFFKLCGT